MWSASSRTVIWTPPRSACPWPMRSSSRPGQAITMSTPRARACTCGFWPTPPKIVVADIPRARARGSTTASTWLASSRVGTSTSPRGRRGWRRESEAASRDTSGMPKARVLPEPVRPRPRTSLPARLSGSVATWIGNGAVMPLAVSTSTSGAGTPRASKVVSVGSTVATSPAGTVGGAGTAAGAAVTRARWSPPGPAPRPRPPRRRRLRVPSPVPGAELYAEVIQASSTLEWLPSTSARARTGTCTRAGRAHVVSETSDSRARLGGAASARRRLLPLRMSAGGAGTYYSTRPGPRLVPRRGSRRSHRVRHRPQRCGPCPGGCCSRGGAVGHARAVNEPVPARRIHPAWWVAAVTFLALVGAAAFRAVPGVLIDPLRAEFGWSVSTISAAVAVNMALYGLTAPFAAALMERFGIRRVVMTALLVVALGSGLTVFMTASWQLVLFWGVLVGLGTGSMALSLVATVTGRWFVARRGLVSGILTAGGSTGQLVFLPLVAWIDQRWGWRPAALGTAAAALAVLPLVAWLLRDRPRDVGVVPYGGAAAGGPEPVRTGAARSALRALAEGARSRAFWLLMGGFFICGVSTNGLIQPHFIPAAHDHGLPVTTAASLLAVVGLFDLAGTVLSGWLTDRVDPRVLLLAYYGLRGFSLFLLPPLFGPDLHASMLAFIVFYGLDWVATVPPTMALCREHFGGRSAVVFGWIFASHQVGSAVAAYAGGVIRDVTGSYDLAWFGAGALCMLAAVLSISIRRRTPSLAPPPAEDDEFGLPPSPAQAAAVSTHG